MILAVRLLVLVRVAASQKARFARRRQTSSSSANQSAISRAADSGESEPWTRLSGIDEREVAADRPGRRVGGVRRAHRRAHVAIAPSPSSTSASVGAEVMKSTSSPKNGFSACSA